MSAQTNLHRLRDGRAAGRKPSWYGDPADAAFSRAIIFEPGFGMDPAEVTKPAHQRYGRSTMTMRWLLRGPRGVTQFYMSTGWTPERQRGTYGNEWMHHEPSGYDLGYHARVPQYEGAEQYGTQPCEYLAAPCWYDGSGLRADDVLLALFDRGEDGVWDALRVEHDALVEVGS